MTEIPNLSNRARYAVQTMIELASADGATALHIISAKINVSQSYLEQLARALKARKLVRSQTGPHGGYELAKAPSEITIADIIDAAQGWPYESHRTKQPLEPDDPAALLWNQIAESAYQQLRHVTLADTLSLKR